MRILMVAAEVTPVIKVGGLADVVGALPIALRQRGHDVRVLIPHYQAIRNSNLASQPLHKFSVDWQQRNLSVTIEKATLPHCDVPLYLLDSPPMFQKFRGVYFQANQPEDARHEMERFVFFAKAALAALPELDWQPDILHAHDWHAAGIAMFSAAQKESVLPVVLTIHNLNIQGRWNPPELLSWLGWSGHELPSLSLRDPLGNLNILQQGIANAAVVNTVSPTYAKEIITPEYGEGLDPDLSRHNVRGILNGIDEKLFNPATDKNIAHHYTAATAAAAKPQNRSALRDRLGLDDDPNVPLIGSVGRMNEQKGYQLVPDILEHLVGAGAQLVILGSGSPVLEKKLAEIVQRWPRRVRLETKFDPVLAQQIYAGSDMFLMPSKFEPCGLGQMIAMRYGTLPIVRATGGLVDSVVDLTTDAQRGTGFVFQQFTAEALWEAIERALRAWRDQARWRQTVQRAMAVDFSWNTSSHIYEQLYVEIKK